MLASSDPCTETLSTNEPTAAALDVQVQRLAALDQRREQAELPGHDLVARHVDVAVRVPPYDVHVDDRVHAGFLASCLGLCVLCTWCFGVGSGLCFVSEG